MLNSIPPVAGVTLNRPGRGGPLVVTVMAALDSPQARVNMSEDLTGRLLAARTKFTTRVLLAGMTEITGVKALLVSLTEVSSTLHAAVHEDWTVTVALNASWRFVLTETTLWAFVVMTTKGAEESCTVTVTVVMAVRAPFDTVSSMMDLVLTAEVGADSVSAGRFDPLTIKGQVLLSVGAVCAHDQLNNSPASLPVSAATSWSRLEEPSRTKVLPKEID